jgi:hypothetical protein
MHSLKAWLKTALICIVCIMWWRPVLSEVECSDKTHNAEEPGVIVGRLLDENGEPQSAKVTALPYCGTEDGKMITAVWFNEKGQLPEERTDDEGRFRIERVPAGKWVLKPSKFSFEGGFVRVNKEGNNIVLILKVTGGKEADAGDIVVSHK